jgi:two-component system response regulator YesN
MYKLILVDDEEEVRKGILEKIEWEKYGFEIAGEAENGIDALEMAERVMADLVITDIKMPFMDGLTLSEKISQRLPTSRIIILTGFDEFEYAQRAVKLDVVEYVLKPISSDELTEILQRVKAKLDYEIAQRKDIEALKEHYKKSLPILREKFLNSLIKSRLKRNEIIEKAPAFGLKLNGKGFIVAVFNSDYKDSGALIEKKENNSIEGSELCNYENRELVNIAVLNTAEEIINKYNSGIIFQDPNYNVIIFNLEDDSKALIMKKVIAILKEIHQSIEKYFNISLIIGVGTCCSDAGDIPWSYENAVAALDYRIILTNNDIICIEDMEPESTKNIFFDEMKERSLISSIKVGTSEEIKDAVESLFKDIIDGGTSFKDYQIYLLEMLTAVLKAAVDMGVDMDGIFGTNYNLFVEIYKFKSLEEVKDWLTGICRKIRSYASMERQDTIKHIVKKALKYVEESYDDSELTIDKMCTFLHISPTYFSTIFKRETRATFVNYLTHVRMEAARELLRTTDIKTFEVARRVGYSEPNYFSYCFKKNFSISPSEYRKGYKLGQGMRT